jgi:hypothetical protein
MSGERTGKRADKKKVRSYSAQELFESMCEWDDANYIVCADTCRPGSKSDTHKTDGVVDGHVSASVMWAYVYVQVVSAEFSFVWDRQHFLW